MPHGGEVAAEARVPDALEEQQLHGALVPPQDLLDTPRQAGRLVGAPGQHLSRLVHIHAAPPLSKHDRTTVRGKTQQSKAGRPSVCVSPLKCGGAIYSVIRRVL